MVEPGESSARGVDVLESVLLVAIPALAFGTAVGLLTAPVYIGPALFVGALFGAILARFRGLFAAYRTRTGVERRYREPRRDTRLVRIAQATYDPRWDRLLVVLLFVVAVGAFAAGIALGGDGGILAVLFIVVGFFALLSSLMTIGSLQTRSRSEK